MIPYLNRNELSCVKLNKNVNLGSTDFRRKNPAIKTSQQPNEIYFKHKFKNNCTLFDLFIQIGAK